MSASENPTTGSEAGQLRYTLAYGLVPATEAMSDASVASAAAATDDRMRVLARLSEKSRKLRQSEKVMQALYDSSTNAQERRDLDLQTSEARYERGLCDSRFTAIANNGPFRDPGPQADRELRDALQAVDNAIRNTAAVVALLKAVHGLVAAFPAEST